MTLYELSLLLPFRLKTWLKTCFHFNDINRYRSVLVTHIKKDKITFVTVDLQNRKHS